MPPLLEELDLSLTMECNLRCGFCSVRANAYRDRQLSLARIRSLIDEALPLGLKDLHLTGGEPTLSPDLEAVIEHAAARGLRTRLISNGTLLGRQRLLRLQQAGLQSLMVSIDGLEATHDALRGAPGSFARALRCVRAALELGMPTRVSAVAFRDNLPELPALMRLSAQLGVQVFSFFLGSPLGRGRRWKDRVIPPADWRRFLQELTARVQAGELGETMQLVGEQGFFFFGDGDFDRAELRGRGAGCSALCEQLDYLIVRGDGALFQCVFLLHESAPLGNLLDEPLQTILQRTLRQHPRPELADLPAGCTDCSCAPLCRGGCRGYAQVYAGDFCAPDPRCPGGEQAGPPPYFPLCPIAKLNLRTGLIRGSSELALG